MPKFTLYLPIETTSSTVAQTVDASNQSNLTTQISNPSPESPRTPRDQPIIINEEEILKAPLRPRHRRPA